MRYTLINDYAIARRRDESVQLKEISYIVMELLLLLLYDKDGEKEVGARARER